MAEKKNDIYLCRLNELCQLFLTCLDTNNELYHFRLIESQAS